MNKLDQMETDITGDVELNLDDVIRSITKKKPEGGAAYIKTDLYAYYPSLTKFACPICVSMLEGDENKAKEHSVNCLAKKREDKGKIFCSICWRSINKENAKDHFFSTGHTDTVTRMAANGSNFAVWLLKGGVSFTRPKNADVDALPFCGMTYSERLDQVREVFDFEQNIVIQIKQQIENAVRSARGNDSTVSARLASNSALIATLRSVSNQATIGLLPCLGHAHGNDVQTWHVVSALHEILKVSSPTLFKTSMSKDRKCVVCGESLFAIDNPKQAHQAVNRVIDTILGVKKEEENKKRRLDE